LALAYVAALLATAACGLTVTGAGSSDVGGTGEPPKAEAARDDASTPLDDSSTPSSPLDDGGSLLPDDASSSSSNDAASDAARPPVFGDECPNGTVYEDDFTFNPAGRWITVAGTWTWNATAKTLTVSNHNPHGVIWIGPRPKWKNYVVEITETGSAPPVATDHGDVGPIFRVSSVGTGSPPPNNAGAMYLAGISFQSNFDLLFGRFEGGNFNERATAEPLNVTGRVTVRVDVDGTNIRVGLGANPTISLTDATYSAGSIGVRTYRAGVVLHKVKVTCRAGN